MRDFTKFNIADESEVPYGVIESFRIFENIFDDHISKTLEINNIFFEKKEILFSILWGKVIKNIMISYNEYFENNVLDFLNNVDGSKIPYLIGKKDIPKPILDKKKVTKLIESSILPSKLLLDELGKELLHEKWINRSLTENMEKMTKSSQEENLRIYVEFDLGQKLKILSMHEKVIYKKNPYYSIIGEKINEVWQKHRDKYGNNKSQFINTHYEYMRKCLKLQKSDFQINSFRKYILK